MSWLLAHRDDQWHVIKEEDGSSEGCHDSRTDAIKHQRALYSREAMVASMYKQLDAQPVHVTQTGLATSTVLPESSMSLELVAMVARMAEEKALVASAAQAREEQQRAEAQEERQALVAALGRLGSPVINLPAPEVNVTVPPAEMTFTVPAAEVTFHAPDVHVNVPPAQITVQPADVVLPERSKTVTFERDPLTQQVTRAEVTEG